MYFGSIGWNDLFVPMCSSPPTFLVFCFLILFIDLLMVALGLCSSGWAFSTWGKWGLLFFVAYGFQIVVVSLLVDHRL